MEPRHEHKNKLIFWNVIDHNDAKWSVWDGLQFADYYYVQHKIFKRVKRIKTFGYRPKDHPFYKEFCEKHNIKTIN